MSNKRRELAEAVEEIGGSGHGPDCTSPYSACPKCQKCDWQSEEMHQRQAYILRCQACGYLAKMPLLISENLAEIENYLLIKGCYKQQERDGVRRRRIVVWKGPGCRELLALEGGQDNDEVDAQAALAAVKKLHEGVK